MLEVKHLSAGYGGVPVLWDVSLIAPTGSVLALLGPNGAGKTTLLRTISGSVKPKSGKVILLNQDVTGFRPNELVGLGLCHIPEGRGIFPSLTVRENLLLFCDRGKARDTLEKAASVFPILGARLRQAAGSLSGGEQQMLAIVRAYLSEPRLVLVDEASMGLAPLVVDALFNFMDHLAKEGTTLLVVEQYVNRALELAENVVILNRGRIVHSGPAKALDEERIFEQYLGMDVA